MNSEGHVTLKTGIMTTEDSPLPSQIHYILKYIKKLLNTSSNYIFK